MSYGNPIKDARRPNVSVKSAGWPNKGHEPKSSQGDGPLSKSNIMGDQGYDKEVKTT